MTDFKKDFIWGVACAAYQCEGGWDADGKGPSIWDDFTHTPGKIANGDTGDVACDHYHRWKEDIAIMKGLGVQSYRFSVSWPRVMPTGRGMVNEKGLQFYSDLVDELLKNGIEPCCTLYHWDLPSALNTEGGWLNRVIADDFAAFAALIAKTFDGRVKYYIPMNEPQCIGGVGYIIGAHAPGLKLNSKDVTPVIHNMLRANGAAIKALRENSTNEIMVGTCTTGRLCYPQEQTAENIEAARRLCFTKELEPEFWAFQHTWFLDPVVFGRYPENVLPPEVEVELAAMPAEDMEMIKQKLDFIGLNIYNGTEIGPDGKVVRKYTGFPYTAKQWPVTPAVMHYGPKFISERYGNLPIIITENGQSCNDRIFLDGKVHDSERVDFLQRYLIELGKCISDGTPVIGYYAWSFFDNFEWADGYKERFGLVYVDYRDGTRIPKDSALWYSEVIATEGEKLNESPF